MILFNEWLRHTWRKIRTSSATKASRTYDLPVGYFRRASTKPREKLGRLTRTVYGECGDKLAAYYEDRNVDMCSGNVNEDGKFQTGDFWSEWRCYLVNTKTYSEKKAQSASSTFRLILRMLYHWAIRDSFN